MSDAQRFGIGEELLSFESDLGGFPDGVEDAIDRIVRSFPQGFEGSMREVVAKACERTVRRIGEGYLAKPLGYMLACVRSMASRPVEQRRSESAKTSKRAAQKSDGEDRDRARADERCRIRAEAKARGETLMPAEVEALVFVDTDSPDFRRKAAMEKARRTGSPAPAWAFFGYDSEAEWSTARANGEGGYKGSATRTKPRTAATIRSPKRGETFDGDLPSVGDALLDTVVGDDVDLSANPTEGT